MSDHAIYGSERPSERDVVFAGFIFRFIAYIIDWIFVTLIALIIGMGTGLALGLTNLEMLDIAYLAGGFIALIYNISFWATMGGTPGKIMLGMRIVGKDGNPNGIGWGRAFLRALGYIVSTIPCYLGFVWIAIDQDKRGWHDRIAGTYVVNV